MCEIQSTCSEPIHHDKIKSKTSSSGGLTTEPVSTQHDNPCKELFVVASLLFQCSTVASNVRPQDASTRPTQIPKRLRNDKGKHH